MKITKVNYMDGEARFILDNDTTKTYCVKLTGKTTTKEITDELKTKIVPPDVEEIKYNSLNLKSLEGTNIQ